MGFTKENIVGLFGDWRKNIISSVDDLEKAIMDLDDTPEKVKLPKFVAEYLEEYDKDEDYLSTALCPGQIYGERFEFWFDDESNCRLFARAWLDGYEVEKEPLYHVLNKDGGLMLYRGVGGGVDVTPSTLGLTKDEFGYKPFYQLTEQEIKDYDERFWPFAVPVND